MRDGELGAGRDGSWPCASDSSRADAGDPRTAVHLLYFALGSRAADIWPRLDLALAHMRYMQSERASGANLHFHVLISECMRHGRGSGCWGAFGGAGAARHEIAVRACGREVAPRGPPLWFHSLDAASAATRSLHDGLYALAIKKWEMEFFFLAKALLHRLLPSWVPRVIFVDSDVVIFDDAVRLWREFDRFSPTELVGTTPISGPVGQGAYPDLVRAGGVSFNTGVVLADLHRLRGPRGRRFDELLARFANHSLPLFRVGRIHDAQGRFALGGLTEQYLFSHMTHPVAVPGGAEFFRTLPCGWNRQPAPLALNVSRGHSVSKILERYECRTPCFALHLIGHKGAARRMYDERVGRGDACAEIVRGALGDGFPLTHVALPCCAQRGSSPVYANRAMRSTPASRARRGPNTGMHSARGSHRPLLVCAPMPHRIALGERAVVHLGGCALDRSKPQLALRIVFTVDAVSYLIGEPLHRRPQDGDEEGGVPRDAPQARVGRPTHLTHLQNVSWVREQHMQVQLTSDAPTNATWSDCSHAIATSAVMSVCRNVPRAIASTGTRFHLTFDLGRGTRAGSSALTLVPSGLTDNAVERAVVWTGVPVVFQSGWDLSRSALKARNDGWRAAGFDDVHVIARTRELCDTLQSLVSGCEVRAAADEDAPRRSGGYFDQRLYNTLGLAYSQAAGYAAIAFVDLDESPGPYEANLGLALQSLRTSGWPYVRAFRFPHLCKNSYCPASRWDMEKAVSDGRCDASAANAGRNEVKIIGRPDSLTSVGVHDVKLSAAYIHPPYGIYNTCIDGTTRVFLPT